MAGRGNTINGALYFWDPSGAASGDLLGVGGALGLSAVQLDGAYFEADGDLVDSSAAVIAPADTQTNGIITFAEWDYACVIEANRSGSTETADVSDRCQTDAQVVTKINTEISGSLFKKRNADGTIPQWILDMRNAFRECKEFYALMLDKPINAAPASGTYTVDGWWVRSLISQFDESQPLSEGIQIDFTLIPSGLTDAINQNSITAQTTDGGSTWTYSG